MNYYAHTSTRGKYEFDFEHAVKAMNLAEQFASHICDSKLMGFIGLTHDAAGKHTKRFQDVLFCGETGINHACASASALLNEYLNIFANDETAMIVYNMIKGHHNGFSSDYLFDGIDAEEVFDEAEHVASDFSYEVDGKKTAFSSAEEYQQAVQFLHELVGQYVQKLEKVNVVPEDGWKNPEEKMLHIRMLMSCLVDADYSATASFENPAYIDAMDGGIIDADQLLAKLDEFRTNLVANAEPSVMNDLREVVYQDATKAGQTFDPGFFQLTAPTGTAKTLALIKFALESAKRNGQSRVILVVPYLTITEQTTAIYKAIFGEDVVLEDDSNAELDKDAYIHAERWSAPVIVTTNVKFYETLFSNKPSVLRKLHHIANAVVMFDESQSLDPKMADITITTLMLLSKYGTSVVLSTATPPAYQYRKYIDYRYQEIISDVTGLYEKYAEVKHDQMIFSEEKMDYAQIGQLCGNYDQRLYVVNTTGKALNLYRSLRESGTTDCFLLYSKMCGAHKKQIIQEIKTRLNAGLPCVVVSTQCIEAGVDLDFPVVCREWAPFSSLIQTFGRLNRNGKYEGIGYVFKTKDHNSGHFPGATYWNNTQLTMNLARSFGFKLDINSLEIQNEYFKRLFSIAETKDIVALRDAVKACDFEEVAENYHVIEEQEGYNVIVPYEDSMTLYESVLSELEATEFVLTRRLMKKVHSLIVNVPGKSSLSDEVNDVSIDLCYRIQGTLVPSGWKILKPSDGMYVNDVGLVGQNGGQ